MFSNSKKTIKFCKYIIFSLKIGELSKIDGIQEIGITTNGIVLNRMIKPLIDAGLTNLNGWDIYG